MEGRAGQEVWAHYEDEMKLRRLVEQEKKAKARALYEKYLSKYPGLGALRVKKKVAQSMGVCLKTVYNYLS